LPPFESYNALCGLPGCSIALTNGGLTFPDKAAFFLNAPLLVVHPSRPSFLLSPPQVRGKNGCCCSLICIWTGSGPPCLSSPEFFLSPFGLPRLPPFNPLEYLPPPPAAFFQFILSSSPFPPLNNLSAGKIERPTFAGIVYQRWGTAHTDISPRLLVFRVPLHLAYGIFPAASLPLLPAPAHLRVCLHLLFFLHRCWGDFSWPFFGRQGTDFHLPWPLFLKYFFHFNRSAV